MLLEFEIAANRMRKKFINHLLIEFILIVLYFLFLIFSNSILPILMCILFFWTLSCFSAYFQFRSAKRDLENFEEQNMLHWLDKRGWQMPSSYSITLFVFSIFSGVNVTFEFIGHIWKNVFPSFTSISFPFKSLYTVCPLLVVFSQVILIAFPFVI